MAAEQNHCTETQRLLGGLSLKLAFQQQALNVWLVMFPREFFVRSSRIPERNFFAFAQHFPSWEACLLASCVFYVCLVCPSPTTSPAGQNPACTACRARSIATPHAAAAHPHPSTAVFSSPH
jgi:hypothetical protein